MYKAIETKTLLFESTGARDLCYHCNLSVRLIYVSIDRLLYQLIDSSKSCITSATRKEILGQAELKASLKTRTNYRNGLTFFNDMTRHVFFNDMSTN